MGSAHGWVLRVPVGLKGKFFGVRSEDSFHRARPEQTGAPGFMGNMQSLRWCVYCMCVFLYFMLCTKIPCSFYSQSEDILAGTDNLKGLLRVLTSELGLG